MSEDKKVKYKINFWKAEKIEINEMKCGNCSAVDSTIYACKYSMKEFDDFSRKIVLKSKSTRLCGKCKYVVSKIIAKAEEKGDK